MRTTLTLEDDVAAMIQQRLKEQDIGLKALINTLLRDAFAQQKDGRRIRSQPFAVQPFNTGKCLVGDVESVAETLALIEGDSFK